MLKIFALLLDFFLSLYCWTVISIFTVIFGIFSVIVSFFSENVSHKIAKLWGSLILKFCIVKVNLKNLKNISVNNKTSYIITSNHQSYFDIFILLAYLNVNFRFIAKKSLFKIPFLGQSMKRLGYIPIDRENLRSALKSAKMVVELLKNKKTSILIFPEGTRSLDGKLSSFKKGGLSMFLKQGDMILLPVVIKGSIDILKKNSLVVHPGKTVELHILEPKTSSGQNVGVLIDEIEQETRIVLES